jgi:hypothetical protein
MGKNDGQVNVKFTKEQREILQTMIGVMGGTEAEVVRNVVIAWLAEKSIASELIKSRWLNKK